MERAFSTASVLARPAEATSRARTQHTERDAPTTPNSSGAEAPTRDARARKNARDPTLVAKLCKCIAPGPMRARDRRHRDALVLQGPRCATQGPLCDGPPSPAPHSKSPDPWAQTQRRQVGPRMDNCLGCVPFTAGPCAACSPGLAPRRSIAPLSAATAPISTIWLPMATHRSRPGLSSPNAGPQGRRGAPPKESDPPTPACKGLVEALTRAASERVPSGAKGSQVAKDAEIASKRLGADADVQLLCAPRRGGGVNRSNTWLRRIPHQNPCRHA